MRSVSNITCAINKSVDPENERQTGGEENQPDHNKDEAMKSREENALSYMFTIQAAAGIAIAWTSTEARDGR